MQPGTVANPSDAERFLVALERALAQARQRLTRLTAASGEAATAPLAVYIWLTEGGRTQALHTGRPSSRYSAKLEADPELASSLLAPVKSQGVRRMEPNGMVVGIKFMAKPGEQFVLRREIYQRIRDAFDRNRIQFARPEVVVVGHPGSFHEAMAAAALKGAHTPDPPPAS